ncbi:MAG: Gfo/Idh/MocA family oxidoreductase, partial [Candidatus Puniceispirillaceae bacterium]
KAEWAAFVAAVLEGNDMPVSLQDGVQALAMAEAAQRSFDSSKPVRLADV